MSGSTIELLKSKTFWSAVMGILGIVGGYATGQVSLFEAIIGIAPIVPTIFVRNALAKQNDAVTPNPSTIRVGDV